MKLTLTDILALWGAIISTILATIKLMDFMRDKAKIKVRVKANYQVYPRNNEYGDKVLIMIEASNRGRRPITLTKAYLIAPRRLRMFGVRTSWTDLRFKLGDTFGILIINKGVNNEPKSVIGIGCSGY